ncbi:hypothetical protein IVA87_17605 [Bradyrhizobium sp. 147]|uniref:DUF6894 family protein n=1 Tax=unclassified Bradyrhizobium TaxID=2631580 RepID=UPI001FF7A26A|nr:MULTISPECIES: hypothetical protein [unclassified Bradyrhizobium]MCK1424329.1 hypothetical protein [Bradyrhizobium sp. CW12]MCK1495437.1 hypothetical protein [Bradyrhizobium sp. 180]MCK1529107.1 hypothetical protein [Bradyrhizobium sp. 182]MCK1541493.1 hypothetical protein [Bradyrhizobium sp. 179]MCK1596296.1 hypothetical protein [Bradyrhizobium sp. 164]
MPLYFFRIRNGRYSGCADQASEFADRDSAWKEMTSVCADMAAGIARKLQENSEWHMELLDEAKEPVFRIRIVAETLEKVRP